MDFRFVCHLLIKCKTIFLFIIHLSATLSAIAACHFIAFSHCICDRRIDYCFQKMCRRTIVSRHCNPVQSEYVGWNVWKAIQAKRDKRDLNRVDACRLLVFSRIYISATFFFTRAKAYLFDINLIIRIIIVVILKAVAMLPNVHSFVHCFSCSSVDLTFDANDVNWQTC